jgi:hypothetical protein
MNNKVTIVHGTQAEARSVLLSTEGVLVKHYTEYKNIFSLDDVPDKVIVWGTLYKESNNDIISTSLFDYLPYADQVIRTSDMCTECESNYAVLELNGSTLCCNCARNAKERLPPTVVIEGTLSVDHLTVKVSTKNPPCTRKRTAANVEELHLAIINAIISVDNSYVGPGITVYHLDTPRALKLELLEKVTQNLPVEVVWR